MSLVEKLRSLPLELKSENRHGRILGIMPDPDNADMRIIRVSRSTDADPRLPGYVELRVPAGKVKEFIESGERYRISWDLRGRPVLPKWSNW